MIADTLQDAEKTYPAEWIADAILLAVKHNKRNWAYCEVILKRWQTEGKDDGGKLEKKASTPPPAAQKQMRLVKPEDFAKHPKPEVKNVR